MSVPLEAVRAAVGETPAYVVGGAVRDRLLDRPVDDVDVALDGDPRAAARSLARATGAAVFPLSEAFGAWRVTSDRWQVDLLALREGDLQADLAARDFTVNAMAEPLDGGELVDPHGGLADLAGRTLRMVAPRALDDDPLRTLRAVRLSVDLDFTIEPRTLAAVREHAPGLGRVAPERVWAELRRLVCAPEPGAAMRRLEGAGLTGAVLPELLPMRGVEQNVFHHLDVHDHTLEVLDAVAALEADPSPVGAHAAAPLAEPLADGLTRWQSMRFAALFHDAGKPATARERADGRGNSFLGHDALGADIARTALRRLRAAERVVDHVAALCLHHLRLGYLVHERPLTPRAEFRYLKATSPWEVDVTVFTCADRLATRGRNSETAIDVHLELARTMLERVPGGRARSAPLVRGDELAGALGIRPGPQLGALLAGLEEARYAGEIATREEAVARARELLAQ